MDDNITVADRDVAEIIRQLKLTMDQHGQNLDSLDTTKSPEGSERLQGRPLADVLASAHINPHLPIAWPTWPEGVLPKFKALCQKVVRRSLRWYIDPIIKQQNEFNTAVAQALYALWQETSQLQKHGRHSDDEQSPDSR